MATVVKGSKIKFAVNIDGLGEQFVSDTSVNLSCDFYINGNYAAGKVTVNKEEMVPDEEGNCNKYYCLVDTALLEPGKMLCATSVTYTDEDLKKTVVEKVQTNTGVNIIDIE